MLSPLNDGDRHADLRSVIYRVFGSALFAGEHSDDSGSVVYHPFVPDLEAGAGVPRTDILHEVRCPPEHHYKNFLGYEKGEDGRPAIVEKEAAVVRLIYRLFLEGKTQGGICRYLEDLGLRSPSGKEIWSKTTITSILTNEKYKGDALLQKTFTVDFLQKKVKANEGEVPQYYVENSRPAIIEPDEWALVQTEFSRRKAMGNTYSGKSVLSA
ncbi:MAG: recombinase family protein, partial [Kiritimatiellae bacterium]|nr:recombinase family protein [Kiritimatiellia bacterium]